MSVNSQTPSSIPFLGTPPIASLPPTSYTIGQLIHTVSQVSTFKFWVFGIAEGTARVSLAQYEVLPYTTIAEHKVSLFNAHTWTPITVTFNVENLDPLATYLISISFSQHAKESMQVAYVPTIDNELGGMITTRGGGQWMKHYSNIAFELTSTSTLTLIHPNYAEGRSNTLSCGFRSTYYAIQVDWHTMKANTGYFVNSSSTLVYGVNCPSFAPVPYGTAANCQDTREAKGRIDLRGTQWSVKDSFTTGGHLSTALAQFGGPDNQVVELSAQGLCGWIATEEANGYGEAKAIRSGGMYLTLEHWQI